MKLVILDRDGVINQDSANYIKSPNEWIPIPNSLEAISLLNQNGYAVVIATNQSGVGRGLYGIEELNNIHAKMIKMLAELGGSIDAIFFCTHTEEDHCDCRKPEIGMLIEIKDRFSVSFKDICGVGDSLRDLEAFEKVGMQPILVKTGNGENTFLEGKYPKQSLVFDDLFEAASKIIEGI
jgi:D-glycero-D-manno-heptose 1,7-bisphosphate phosphatase